MNCVEARRALGAEPARRTPELEAHLRGCAECARYAAEVAAQDASIRRALAVPVPPAGRQLWADAAAPRPRPRWLALAAGLAGAGVLAGVLWILQPREALATAVVGHMVYEPQAWAATHVPVPPEALGYVLGRSGIALAPDAPLVSYASSCFFRGWYVPHLVVQTPAGPVTVMVLRHEHVERPTPIDEGGYRGVIVPAGRGAFAVLAPAAVDAASLDEVIARVAAAVRFIG